MKLTENERFLDFLKTQGFTPRPDTENEFLFELRQPGNPLYWLYSPLSQHLVATPVESPQQQIAEKTLRERSFLLKLTTLRQAAFQTYQQWAQAFFTATRQTVGDVYMEFYSPLTSSPSPENRRRSSRGVIADQTRYQTDFPRAYFFPKERT